MASIEIMIYVCQAVSTLYDGSLLNFSRQFEFLSDEPEFFHLPFLFSETMFLTHQTEKDLQEGKNSVLCQPKEIRL